MRRIANRYARVLVTWAQDLGQLSEFYECARALTQRKECSLRLQAPQSLVDFLSKIPKCSRRAVLKSFVRQAHAALGIVETTLYTATPLDASQQAMLIQRLTLLLNKKPILTIKEDPQLLGGLRIVAEGLLWDDSLKARLSGLQKVLYEEVLKNG